VTKTRRDQGHPPAVPVGTIERSQDSETKIPSTVHTGGFLSYAFSKQARAKLFRQQASGRNRQADLEKLTKTERLVYPMLEAGLSNKQIAEKLGVSEGTARTHVRHILRKLHLKSRSKLVKS